MYSYISKYHKKIGFKHVKELKIFIENLNNKNKILISNHAKNRISEKIPKNEWQKLHTIFMQKIHFNDIIEYTFINDRIEKILVRKAFNKNNDIVISYSYFKMVLTIFINNKFDTHKTLNYNQYEKV